MVYNTLGRSNTVYATLGGGNMVWTIIHKTLCGMPVSCISLGPHSKKECWDLANEKYNKLIAIIPGNHEAYIKNNS